MRTASAGAAVASVAFSRRSFAPSDQQRSVPCDVDAHTSVGSAVPTSFPSWARSASRVGRRRRSMLSESVFAVQMAVRTADRLAKDDEEIDEARLARDCCPSEFSTKKAHDVRVSSSVRLVRVFALNAAR